MRVEVPTVDVFHVASLDRSGEDKGDHQPSLIVVWVSGGFVSIERWQHSLVVHNIQIELRSGEGL
jgi:hypothetical protein